MEDNNQVGQTTILTEKNLLCFSSNSSDCEPQRKKRCLRFPSDLSNEDPLLVGDSGFAELTGNKFEENGDSEVSSFFSVDQATELFEDANHGISSSVRTTSIDTLSLSTDLSDLPDPEVDPDAEDTGLEAVIQLANTSSSTNSSSISDPGCSSLSSSNSQSSPTDCDNCFTEKTWGEIFTNKEIQGHPGRIALMQRFLSHLRSDPDDATLQRFMNYILSCPEFAPPRHKLRHVTTIQDATRLLRCSKRILVLTGAGISVSCGIPDFRSKDGLYSRVSKVFPHLKDPQSVFDIRLFRRDPRPFFLTAKELYPGQFEPSLSHKFIRALEKRGQLLRNYSQNIDTLETIAGIDKVTMCHGSFATATCISCKFKVKSDDIQEKVVNGEIPFCTNCSTPEEKEAFQYAWASAYPEPGMDQNRENSRRLSTEEDDDEYYPAEEPYPLPPVLKPDIVFFGEDLPDEFHNNLSLDKPVCDLLLVIGSSLRVRPVSLIPGMLPPEVPQILINRESLPHCTFDVELLGNCDTIISQLCRNLGSDFMEFACSTELKQVEKLPRDNCKNEPNELLEPQSENDIQALKACWEPKINENITSRLPAGTFLHWRPRQYVFEGAEVDYDPDEEDDDDSDSTSSGSDSDMDEVSSSDNRESGTDSELASDSPQEPTVTTSSKTSSISTTITDIISTEAVPATAARESSEQLVESTLLETVATTFSNINSLNGTVNSKDD